MQLGIETAYWQILDKPDTLALHAFCAELLIYFILKVTEKALSAVKINVDFKGRWWRRRQPLISNVLLTQ